MAEFCYKCFCKFWEKNAQRKELVFSDDFDLCEGCGKYEKIVVGFKIDILAYKFRHIIKTLKILIAILLLPVFPLILLVRKIKKRNLP